MNYREQVIAYADIIQIFSGDEWQINEALEAKVREHSHDLELREYWVEVQGRIHRNSYYKEIQSLIEIERKRLGNIDQYPNVFSLVNSPTTLEWISYLSKFEVEVNFLLDHQKEAGILERPSIKQKFDSTLGALQFYNKAILDGAGEKEMFKYLGLMKWSIEALITTRQLHEDFFSFIEDSVIPVFRAHRATIMIFLDLVENEEEYLQKEDDAPKDKLTTVSIFGRDYEAEEIEVVAPIDPKKTNPEAEDPYLDTFSHKLRKIMSTGKLEGVSFEAAARSWHFAPLANLYKLRMHTELLGCTDTYIPAISPKLLSNSSNKLYTHIKVYSERNLLETSILGIENLIMESQKTQYKDLYKVRFKEALEATREVLNDLIETGLVTAKAAQETLKRVEDRGEIYEIYSKRH